MKIACIQINAGNHYEKNLEKIESYLAQAFENHADIVMLPEMFAYMDANPNRTHIAHTLDTGVFSLLKSWAQKYQCLLIGGSHAEKSSVENKVYNTATAWDKHGNLLACYRKIHLFNLYTQTGEKVLCENDSYLPGTTPCSFDIPSLGKAALAICYDLRFPELFRCMQQDKSAEPLDFIFLPAAFTHTTGKAHWEILLRARAIENQCFVIGCNQTGTWGNGQRNYGHSMIIHPWGDILAKLHEEEGILFANLPLNDLQAVRNQLPALKNRTLYFMCT